ncbi:hypothetical protein DERP_010826 [Dermatophagoides pteronyssinus]|uniref:Uncharacterized protein n=1 Tax=Dermatophagoides pteronyssinus TaxID=6956 RepID=A0ABQ8J6V4_DERPT|nr:hypothetical protein DERP_010826 [Dermatophagoides pteronyssinus]
MIKPIDVARLCCNQGVTMIFNDKTNQFYLIKPQILIRPSLGRAIWALTLVNTSAFFATNVKLPIR